VVTYDIANPRARVAWERHRQDAHPISVVLSEDPIPDLPWVLQKPVRTQHLIPFLNGLSDWMAQHHTATAATAIRTISDIPPINTDVPATDAVSFLKARTTVTLDYGELTLADRKKLRLYSTPGQRRYDFMSKILSRGALGLMV